MSAFDFASDVHMLPPRDPDLAVPDHAQLKKDEDGNDLAAVYT